MRAAMETLEWPEGVSKPEFMTREYGKTTGERASRVRDACSFELWASLFADNCVLLFQSRGDLIRGPVTSLLIFGNSGFACMLVVVMQRPRMRKFTSHRLEWRTRLRTHPTSTLMALVSLIFVRSSSTWARCFTTRLPLMQMLTSE